jgi:crotonobetainyl-CoA:carnitine CoA-transferase CaiB-like acyl-CoA transferase
LIGRPDLIEDPRFLTARGRLDHADEFDEIVIPWFMERTKNELFHTCSLWRIPCAPVAGPGELVNDPHFQERGFWVEIDHPETGRLTYPGAPFKMSETPWQAQRAPLLGEHNEEIYCQRLGYTKEDSVKLRQAGII